MVPQRDTRTTGETTLDETFFQEWRQELRAFHQDTAARLAAHDQAIAAHAEQRQAMQSQHDETLREMRAEHAVWLQTQEGHTQSFQAIRERLADAFIDHEARLSAHQRAMQEISTTLQQIRDSL